MKIPVNLTRDFVRANPDILFIIAGTCNRCTEAGDPAEFAFVKNVYFAPVKIKPCMDVDAFFKDTGPSMHVFSVVLGTATKELETMFAANKELKYIVHDPRIGQSNWTGPMISNTPQCYNMLMMWLKTVCTPNMEIDYRL